MQYVFGEVSHYRVEQTLLQIALTASPTAQYVTGGLGTSSVVGIAVAAFLLGAAITPVGVIVVLR